LLFNTNQTAPQNDTKFSAGPVKATPAAVEGSASKSTKNATTYNITEKKVAEIAACLGMN